ncbi:MAG: hypothetical protein MUF71_14240 [Candidatus Kapabacteria bacterium]|jgi:hypothetical protein|nr:hypothetical protein [Candidatus Kapabacteria bacterium]
MKNSILHSFALCIKLVLLFSLVACDLTNPINVGSQDYIPLAVGNQWEYTNVHTRFGRTPNGPYTASRSTYIKNEIIAAKRKSDTIDVFTMASSYGSLNSLGFYDWSYDTTTIERTPSTIYDLPRTGKDSILTITIYPGPGYAKYKKGVGRIESQTSGSFHITAGNQGDYTSRTVLTKYTVK